MSVTLPDASVLRQRLSALRQQLRQVALYRGVSMVLALALPCALLAGLLDWTWPGRDHLPSLIRALFLTGILSGSAILVYRYLYCPLRERVDDLSLALRIEESYPSLNDSLASTVEFLNQSEAHAGESAAMRREAVRRALGNASACDFNRIVDRRGLAGAMAAAFVAANLVWPLFLLAPAKAGTALVRLLNPFGKLDWPRQTQIALEKPVVTRGSAGLFIGRNELFEVRGKVTGVIPEQAHVIFSFDSFRPEEHRIDLKKTGDQAGVFATRIEPGRIQRTFSFRVEANDANTEDYEVKVLPPPELVAVNGLPSPQLKLYFPAYTDLPSPQILSPGTGNIDAVLGTFVEFRAAADRPLRQAWLEYRSEQTLTPLSGFLAPLGANNLAGALALSAGGQAAWETVPARLDSESRRFISVEFLPRLTGFYVLHFEDENHLHNSRIFELRLKLDPAPTVTFDRPSPTRDMLSMLPTADVKIQASADDPEFAVRSVYLRYRIRRAAIGQPPAEGGETAAVGETRRLFLYDPETLLQRSLPKAVGPGARAWRSLKLRPGRVDLNQMLSLKGIRHLDGSPLAEGDVVILQVCADDYDDVTPDKQPGVSHEVELRIVSPNSLDLELNMAQKLVQEELLRLREKQREAIQKVQEAERRLRRGEKLKPEEQAQLVEAEQLQQQIHERVGTEDKGLRADVARIQETLKQNGLQNSAIRERMVDVARELNRLAERELEQVENRLAAAQQTLQRQSQLGEKAREGDKLSQSEEQTAQRKAQAAAEAERKAKLANSAPEKARLEAEAQRQKQQAEAARQKAEELRKQAAKDGQDSNQQSPRQQLTEARQHQEEVEKTINDLLTQLEPWSSAREVKGDAKRLLEEQKQLHAQLEEMKQKVKQGQPVDMLTPQEKADLKALADQQGAMEEQTRKLLDKMERLAEKRESKDPDTARELRDAREQALQGNITEQMKSAQNEIGNNQLNDAQKNQQNSIGELEKLVKNLEDRREAELDRLAKKLREAEKKLEELKDEQEKLAKKIKEAQQNPDAAKREEELKRLSAQQQKLQEETQELVKQLSRARADRAGQALEKASSQMGQTRQRLNEGKNPEDAQETLDRLDEAQRELERARKQAEDELQREQLLRVAETIGRLKERQEGLNTKAIRIQTEVQQNNEWKRSLRSSLNALGDDEAGLGSEVDSVARKELTSTPVFARMLRQSAEAMDGVNKRIQEFKKDQLPDPKTLPDPELARLQQLAAKRLTQVLDAVKEQAGNGNGRPGAGQSGGSGDGGEGGGGGGDDSGLPPVAQLKLLKALQLEINQQTEAFQKAHPDLDRLNDADKAQLQLIRRQQQDIVELLEELRRPANEPGDPEGDKK